MHLCAGGRFPRLLPSPSTIVPEAPTSVMLPRTLRSVVCCSATNATNAAASYSHDTPKKSDLRKVPGVGKRNQELLMQQHVPNVQALAQIFEQVG